MTENPLEPKLLNFQNTMTFTDLSRYKLKQYIECGLVTPVYVDDVPYFKLYELQELQERLNQPQRILAEIFKPFEETKRKLGDICGR